MRCNYLKHFEENDRYKETVTEEDIAKYYNQGNKAFVKIICSKHFQIDSITFTGRTQIVILDNRIRCPTLKRHLILSNSEIAGYLPCT
jgi:hypothetical protein